RKTDKIDTARLQREFLAGSLPLAHQPPAAWRQLRRLVAFREGLVGRRTALRNWVNRYLAHETWADRTGLWSAAGQARLRALLPRLPPTDAHIVAAKLDELGRLQQQLEAAEAQLHAAFRRSPPAQRLDAIRGIGAIAAIAIVAWVGPVERFRSAEQLIAFAGLAPGVQQSDQTRRAGRLGGGGTDRHLRHYLIEASVWARPEGRSAGGGPDAAAGDLQGAAGRRGLRAGLGRGRRGAVGRARWKEGLVPDSQVGPRGEPRTPPLGQDPTPGE